MSTYKPYCLAFFKNDDWHEKLFDTENDMENYYNILFYDTNIEVMFFKYNIEYIPTWVE